MKAGQAGLSKRIDDLNSRLDNMNNTMLALFGAMITLIVGIFAYIAWDRRTMMRPVLERLDRLEKAVTSDLHINK
ncbi:MAG: hypothetical protein DSZ23_05380 [Thermodesulfatator sp.]|nr:MAG: hypothetical protein DSZ23_05380 [Thermodesulfatator sp.]